MKFMTVNKITHTSLGKIAGLAGSLLMMSQLAMAGETVDKQADTSDSPNVEIEHVSGVATIKGWDKNQVKVTGELGERTEEFIFRQDGNDVLIKVETNHRHINWRNGDPKDGDKLTIFVPEKTRLTYSAVIADVDASNLSNDSKFELVNGDIKAKDLSGRVKLESVNGDIDMKNIQGLLNVETVNGNIKGDHKGDKDTRIITVNGDINLSTTSPSVMVESVNGGAKLDLADVRELSLTTVNGDMHVSMNLLDNGDVDVSSVGGTIALNMQPSVSARFEIQAHAGGDIENRLSGDKPSSAKYGPNKWLEFTHNGGKARVEMSTVHGDLIIDNVRK